MGYLETIKNITKDKKRKKENLILLLVLLVIMLISINYIFEDNKSSNRDSITENKSIKNNSNNSNLIEDNVDKVVDSNEVEAKIENILNKINGVTDVSVIINYKNNGKNEYAYDEKYNIDNDGNISSNEKNIAYNDIDGNKEAITSVSYLPEVEGVIIVGSGVGGDVSQRIATAVASLLGIPSYKVQVFSK